MAIDWTGLGVTNEEELKAKVVLPALKQFGIKEQDLSFETSFTVQLGKRQHKVAPARGHLDLLVKRGGRCLCVIELKAPSLGLQHRDTGQVVSYARLVGPNIAPLCVLTNGSDTKFIDTLSSEELTDVEVQNVLGAGHEPTLDKALLREALGLFVGYSTGNLTTVSKQLVEERSARVRGSHQAPDRAYIPELYVLPSGVRDSVAEFCNSDAKALLITGASGSGKTCAVTHSADVSVGNGVLTFFYLARDVENGIFAAIANDLNWVLSDNEKTGAGAAREIARVFCERSWLVFVDNLDELSGQSARRITEDFLSHAPVGAKLVASCTTRFAPSILIHQGSWTEMNVELSRRTNRYRIELQPLDWMNHNGVIERYRRFYGYNGRVDPRLEEDGRKDPLLLRLAFDALGNGALGYDVREFYEVYFSRKLARGGEEDRCRRYLKTIATHLVEADLGATGENDLRSALALGIDDDIPAPLFKSGVLFRSGSTGQHRVGFSYSRMRDFVYAFWCQDWRARSDAEVRRIATEDSGTGYLRAVATYYALADERHQRLMDEPVFDKAASFFRRYQELVRTHFPFAHECPAHELGFVGQLRFEGGIPRIWGYGIRKVVTADRPVHLIPTIDRGDVDQAFEAGVESLIWSGAMEGFGVSFDARGFAQNQLSSRLKERVKRGCLYEGGSIGMCTNRVLASFRPTGTLVLEDAVTEVLWDAMADRKAFEKIVGKSKLDIVSYVVPKKTHGSQLHLEARALSKVVEAELPPALLAFLPSEDIDVLSTIRTLRRKGLTMLSPPPQQSLTESLSRTFSEFLSEYRSMVATNFVGLAQKFELARRPGVTIVFDVAGSKLDFSFAESTEDTVFAVGPNVHVSRDTRQVIVDGIAMPIFSQVRTSLDYVLRPYHRFGWPNGAPELNAVRSMVYSTIESELDSALADVFRTQ